MSVCRAINALINKYNEKRCVAQKQVHKDTRVAANSDVPFSALDNKECPEGLSNLTLERQTKNSTLKHAAVKLTKQKEKYIITGDTSKHRKQAMKDLTTKNEPHQGLKEALFSAMKDLEASDRYAKKRAHHSRELQATHRRICNACQELGACQTRKRYSS